MSEQDVRGADLQAVRARLLGLSTGLVSDALGKTGAMDHGIQGRSAVSRMAGPAFTVRVHTADILMVGQAVSNCPAEHVLVIDGHGERNTALWGDIITHAARLKRLAGVVIDGAIRDSAEIRKSSFPVFARSCVPNAGGAEYVGELDLPVQCGGLVVNPRDWVAGDEDGVAVVPAARLAEILAAAEALREIEHEILTEVLQGRDLGELLRYDEILARKRKAGLVPQLRFRPGK